MKDQNSGNIDSKQKLLSPEQLRNNLLKINKTFCNYIQSLSNDYDESPENLNKTMANSSELINEFTQFYQNFNMLFDKCLKESNNQNKTEKNLQTKNILIDNKSIKFLSDILSSNNNKLKKINEETKLVTSGYEEEFNNIIPKNIKSK